MHASSTCHTSSGDNTQDADMATDSEDDELYEQNIVMVRKYSDLLFQPARMPFCVTAMLIVRLKATSLLAFRFNWSAVIPTKPLNYLPTSDFRLPTSAISDLVPD